MDDPKRLATEWNINVVERVRRTKGGIDHINYVIQTRKEKVVMTFIRREEKKYVRVQERVAQVLGQSGIRIPRTRRTKSGKRYVPTENGAAIVTEFLEGKHRSPPLPHQLLVEFGRVLGKIDATLGSVQGIGGKGWIDFKGDERELRKLQKRAPAIYAQLHAMKRLSETHLVPLLRHCRKSVVHGDFHPWNVLVQGSKITGVVDLYDLHRDYLVWDLAVAIAHCCGKDCTILPGSIKPLVSGYESMIRLNNTEKKALYWFVLYRWVQVAWWLFETARAPKERRAASRAEYTKEYRQGLQRGSAWQQLGADGFARYVGS